MRPLRQIVPIVATVGILVVALPTMVGASEKSHALTGLGATKSAWAKSHHRDTSNCPGHSCFGYPVPGAGANGYEYSPMSYQSGRVVGWQGSFLNHTTLAEAEASVLKQLPADTKVVSFMPSSGCAFWQLQSAAIEKVLGPAGYTGGDIGVEFQTINSDGTGGYNPNNVNTDTVGSATVVSGPGC
jgi:hypothetical protein